MTKRDLIDKLSQVSDDTEITLLISEYAGGGDDLNQYDLLLKTDTDEVFIIKERYIFKMCDNISELEYTKDLITL